MASLGTIFLLLILFFLLLPVFKVGLKIYGFQKQAKKAFSQFNQQQQRQTEEYETRQKRQQQRQRRKSMGEYVEFEEIDSSQPSVTTTQKKSCVKDEPLITDAEWEEI